MLGLRDLAVVDNHTYNKVKCERRFMISAVVATVTGAAMMIVAISTTSWCTVAIDFPSNRTRLFYIGIWYEWEIITEGDMVTKKFIAHFPHPPPDEERLKIVATLNHFYRTQAVFSAVGLALMVGANGSAIYSLLIHHRYMYKRLAAFLFAFSAMCILIVIEVMINSISRWHVNLKNAQARKEQTIEEYLIERTTYGFSTVLAWLVFAIYATGAVIFLIGSRKRKGDKAATEDFEYEDRPVELGRL